MFDSIEFISKFIDGGVLGVLILIYYKLLQLEKREQMYLKRLNAMFHYLLKHTDFEYKEKDK